MTPSDPPEIDPFEWSCPLCKSGNHTVAYDLREKFTWFAVPGLILRCADCGMWYKALAPDESLDDAYGEEYAEKVGHTDYMEHESTRGFFQKLLARIEGVDAENAPRLLDIGAGTGTFIEEAAKLGYDAEGIELSEGLVEIARQKGRNVRQQDVNDLDQQDQYDVITLLDIIEHVTDPVAILKSLHGNLKPGGTLVIFTPNHGSSVVLIARILEKIGIRFPVREIFGSNHVCFFDTKTLPKAIEAAGFQVDSVWKFPYDVSRSGQPMSLLNLIVATLSDWIGYPFGTVFRMVHYARKSE